MVKMLTEKG